MCKITHMATADINLNVLICNFWLTLVIAKLNLCYSEFSVVFS